MAGLTFLRVVPNSELAKQERELADAELQARQNQPVILGLTAYLRECWEAARVAKRPIEDRMLKAMRQRNGEYEPDKLTAIREQGGSEVFMMITDVKCRAAESWLRDILMDDGTPPWGLKPTPLPTIDPDSVREIQEAYAQEVIKMVESSMQAPTEEEMMELKEMVAQDYRFKILREAHNRTEDMQRKIEDQFAQGGWPNAFNDFITDLVTFPCAFIKGPIVRRQRTLAWGRDEVGNTIVEPTERLGPEYERVDPFYVYPEPGVTNFNEGYLFEYHPMPRSELADLIGVPGYDDDAIRKVLDIGNGQSWINEAYEQSKEEAESKFYTEMRPTEVFDALEFWGPVSGKMLLDWGVEPEDIDDPAQEYDANVWIVGNYVIKAVLNYDPLGEKPYAKTAMFKVPGAFWGRGIPEVIEDVQNVCNAAARALVNNMGIASGPQVEVNVERIPPNEDITSQYPWKIWQVTNDPVGSSAPAVRFNQPNDNASTLIGVYEKFSRLADDHSGIPAYVSGNVDVQGAGRTASGLSMLMGSAGKGIRQIVMHIDNDVIKPIVHRQYVYNMRYDSDESIKGDVQVQPRGAINLAIKETVNVRRIEFLNATANPVDIEIIGKEGRAAILREVAKSLQMPVEDVVPSREKEMYQTRVQASMAAQAAQAPQATQPDGSPRGGQDGNVVSNRDTGAA
jgi:hypothetical protein